MSSALTKRLLEALKTPHTRKELRDLTGLTKYRIYISVEQLCKEGLIHICRWQVKPGRQMAAVYVAGPGANAKQPLTRKMQQLADLGEENEDRINELFRRPHAWMSAPARRDPLVAALFGDVRCAA